MTSTVLPTVHQDDADLTSLGYQPTLHRKLGRYASFAAGFSFVSILTTIFQLFAFGYSFAGPAFFWTWPVVLVGQLLVALNFAELAARYPLSGAVYQWARRVGGEGVGWFAGWFMAIAQVVTAAAAAIALQVVLPQLWDGFQVVGGDPALNTVTGASNAVVLGAVLLVATTIINSLGVKLMAHVNSVGVTCEIVGVAAVILALISAAQRGPDVVADTSVLQGSDLGAVGAFLVSGLMAAYVMVGFNSAGELSEETKDPRRTAPRTILSALLISGVGGALMIITALMAAPSLDDGRLATEGLPYVLTAVLGTFWGKVLLVDVAIAIFVCTLAIQTAGSRLVFSMARDGKLPASRLLSSVHPTRGTPMWPSIVIGALAVAVLAINVGNAALFTTLCSVCIVMVYLAYLLVTVPQLANRLRGDWDRVGQAMPAGLFSLGRWGLPVNILAVLYGAVMVVNLAWPRPEVYDPSGENGLLLWSAPLMVTAVLLLGLWVRRRNAAIKA
ncbi:amino acid permease [Pseudarthrobacter sp902506025]|uniref:Urea carboxylase system permease n=1 Tax=Pseudarthrobacter defluvii TaxID=410837 RepID=A0ABT9UMT7_9MICC|nr:amino acid permease [Pseudarthrobacter defluvii]MDQ0120582.1 urea carboxylase system permease [Pseudarthrobacter defluvii]